ncbi:MAG: translocation/assembly module TamB domain-containing protein [Gammaproteobacteria bacterium]|nr:translocation/assembly module TamB domain-containing protein [Gammaproteobacteria bacterium]
MAPSLWRWLRLLLSFTWRLTWAPLSLLLLGLLSLGALWALLHDEWLTEQVVSHLPGVTVVAPRGALLGDFEAARLEVSLPREGRLVWQQPAWQGLRLVVDRSAPWWLGVQVDRLSGRRIDLKWVPDPQAQPSPPPTDLSLPLSLTIGRLEIAELHGLTGGQPLRGLDAELRLGAMRHAVRLRSLSWTDWRLSGELGLGGTGAMPLEADLQAEGRREASSSGDGLLAGAGLVKLRAQGPLKDFGLQLDVRWQPERGSAQSVRADVGVQPFASWPVSRGRLDIEALDLAALWPGLPRSEIRGRVGFEDLAARDLVAKVDLGNGLAGAWDQGRLPWLAMKGQLSIDRKLVAQAGADTWREVRTDLVVSLPGRTAQQPARLLFIGPLMGRAPLVVGVQDLAPRALLGSLPDLALAGELRWRPDAAAAGLSGALDLRLDGTVHEVAGRSLKTPVSISLGSQLSPQRWAIKALQLASGEARAQLDDVSLRWGLAAEQGGWAAMGRVRLDRFDPRAWLPWPTALQGETHLSGQGQFEVDGKLAGAMAWTLSPSSLAGVPLSGRANWSAPRSAQGMTLDAQATLGGNRLSLKGQAPRGLLNGQRVGSAGRWELDVQAPDIASLSPWAGAMGAERMRGRLSLTAQGAWPLQALTYRVSGQDIAATRADRAIWQLASVDGQGELDLSRADGRMSAKWSLQDARLSSWRLARLALSVDGSAASHRIRLDGEGAPVREGEVDTQRAVRLAVGVSGNWRSAAAERAWQARLSEAQLTWDQPRGRPALFRLEPTDLGWRVNDRQSEWLVAATRLQVMGLNGQLDRLVWRTPGGQPGAEAMREVSLVLPPFPLAPWLALWQPEEGWTGDLVSGGEFKLVQRGTQPWEVDALISRRSGDLSFSEPGIEGGRPQRLGLREARVSLRARQGVWVAEQRIDGRVLGLLTGRQVVQPLRADAWPDPTSSLGGEVKLDVSNLRALATWVPAGWRLGGRALVQASLGGTLGAPQFTGRIEGSGLSASQALLGISLHDGQLNMALDGERIRLTRLDATGGPQGGRIGLEGELRLDSPLSGRLALTMDRFAALQRIDRRVVVSGRAETTLSDWNMVVKGQFGVDEGFIDISRGSAATIGDDVNVINRPGDADKPKSVATSGGAQGKQLTLDTDLAVGMGDRLSLKGHGLTGLLKGQLRITTPRNKPAVHGAIRLEQAKFAAYGQKLDIERSAITFNGLIENPRLDILAMRPQTPTAQDSDVKVGVRITGTAQDPRIRLYSEPTLSETEQLSWLVLGRAPTGLGGADIGLLQTAAVALLSGDDGPGVTDRVIGLLGLDTLSVSQSDGAVRDTVVSVGKQISRHWYMGYERNLSATGGNWQLIYSLAQRFKVRAQAGEDNAIDFIWQWRWR